MDHVRNMGENNKYKYKISDFGRKQTEQLRECDPMVYNYHEPRRGYPSPGTDYTLREARTIRWFVNRIIFISQIQLKRFGSEKNVSIFVHFSDNNCLLDLRSRVDLQTSRHSSSLLP